MRSFLRARRRNVSLVALATGVIFLVIVAPKWWHSRAGEHAQEVIPIPEPEAKRANAVSIRKPVLLVGVIALLAAAALGTSASLNATTRSSSTFSSGTFRISLGTDGTASNRVSVATPALYPGDSAQRVINITNPGSIAWQSLTMTGSATSSSALDTDATNGLQVAVDECSVAWTESGTSPNYSYSCSGTTTARVSNSPVVSTVSIGGAALNPTTTGYYRLQFTLPTSSPSSAQGLSSSLSYLFNATQPPGS